MDLQKIGNVLVTLRIRIRALEAAIEKIETKMDRVDLAVIDTIITAENRHPPADHDIFLSKEEAFGPLKTRK